MKDAAAEGKKKRAAELDRKRREDVVFFPLNLDSNTLTVKYAYMWGRAVPKGHGAPVVLPEGDEVPPNSYRFFCAYFLCGLSPFSDFFEAMMVVYGFHLLDFMPNAIACMAIFIISARISSELPPMWTCSGTSPLHGLKTNLTARGI